VERHGDALEASEQALGCALSAVCFEFEVFGQSDGLQYRALTLIALARCPRYVVAMEAGEVLAFEE